MSKTNNVNLWFARNNSREIITIDKSIKNEKYTCPICGYEVIPKAKNSIKISPHFSHLDKSKCDSESMIHFWIKNELVKVDDYIKLNNGNGHRIKNISIEKEIMTKHGLYIPDITIETYDNCTIYIEVNHTNKKNKNKYLQMWRDLGNTVVEVRTKDILNNSHNKDNYEYKVIYDYDNDFDSYDKIKNKFKINVKKNSIGEEVLLDIDWFLKEIESYDKYDFDKTYIAINEAINMYKKDVIELLNNSNCSEIKRDYIDYKIKKIYCGIKDILECELKCGNDFVIMKAKDYVLSPCSIWYEENEIIEMFKRLIFVKEKEISEMKIREKERNNVVKISDNIYEDINRRYSLIGVVCEYDKTNKHNYNSKIAFPYKDIYVFFKNDGIDICESYEYTTRKYIYNPKRHMSTPRWIKNIGYKNIKTFDLNCPQKDINDFISLMFRYKKYDIGGEI